MTEPARITVSRGGHLESTHRVHARVVIDGRPVAAFGAGDRLVVMRSCAKPLQALPLVEDGVLGAVGLGDDALALACASHNAEDAHVETARRMLDAFGCTPDDLECGGHPPLDRRTHEARLRAGHVFGPVDSNCSGKHAGMLGLARHHGWETAGYRLPDHPVQRRILDTLARWTELPSASIATAVDGCGVVCFGIPLGTMAETFARFADAAGRGDSAPATVDAAMRAHPFLVGGSRRLCTSIVEATGGRIRAKIGAEGVYAAWGATPDGRPFGLGLKVEDGARRAVECALVGVLEAAALLTGAELEALARWRAPVERNTRGDEVGGMRFEAGR